MNEDHTRYGGPPRYPFPGGTALSPPGEYARLRREEPVSRVTLPYGGAAWLVVRHSDVRFVLSDPVFSRAASIRPGTPRFFEHPVAEGMGYLDPPEHTRLRQLLNGVFTYRRVAAFRENVVRIVGDLLDGLDRAEPATDLQAGLAVPLAGRGVCEFVGVPYAEQDRFAPFFAVVTSTDPPSPEETAGAIVSVQEYFAELMARERREPTDTFFGALVRRNDEERRVSDQEVATLAFGVVVAAYETTSAQFGNTLALLLSDRRRLIELRYNPEIVSSAVEETMRYTQLLSYGGNPFVATADVKIAGTVIEAGDVVVPSINAANRDERVFADPDALDLRRQPNPHLGFAHGPHYCVGAPLARAEMELGLRGLLDRLPALRLAVAPEDLAWRPGRVMRCPAAIPATW
ncbi:cytochrome P450 [Nonomuraea typhae]|uniref:cytochrome P450 n=1 Tax=Nonomuraea typhae TaxID=2603600 RepID=UPI0012FC597C|nr:cytochrome P450 [Nonomuraea typhae]